MRNIEIFKSISTTTLPSGEIVDYADSIIILDNEVYLRDWLSDDYNYKKTETNPSFITNNGNLFERDN